MVYSKANDQHPGETTMITLTKIRLMQKAGKHAMFPFKSSSRYAVGFIKNQNKIRLEGKSGKNILPGTESQGARGAPSRDPGFGAGFVYARPSVPQQRLHPESLQTETLRPHPRPTAWELEPYTSSLVAQMVKNSPAMQETWVPCLAWEALLEKGTATHSCSLAWKIHGHRSLVGCRVGYD